MQLTASHARTTAIYMPPTSAKTLALRSDAARNAQIFGVFAVIVALSACGGAAQKESASVAAAAKPAPPPKPKTDAEKLTDRCNANMTDATKARDELVARMKTMGMDAKAQRDVALGLHNKLLTAMTNAEAESSLWRSVHPDGDMRKAAEKCEQAVAKLSTDHSLDKELFVSFTMISLEGASALQKRIVTKTIEDFRRAGVDKDDASRKRLKELNEQLVKLGQSFSKAIIADRRVIKVKPADLKGLPADWIKAHAPDKKGLVSVSTDYPDYIPFMTYSESDDARKKLYLVYRQRGQGNAENFQKILETRHEMAKILGFANWAALVTADKMIGSDVKAHEFIEKVRTISEKRAKAELKMVLKALRRSDRKLRRAKRVGDWQKQYIINSLKKTKFDFDAQKLRPYLHYSRVKKGLLDLTSYLFNIEYKARPDIAKWHQDVDVYDVLEGGKTLGRIYLDMHPRDNKYKHAAQFTLTNGLLGVQQPAGVLVCNFPNPRTGNGLMEHKQVTTFFHEFGHLMHHILGGQSNWMRFSGVATEWDFVEAPSQIFEEWATDYETLKRFAADDKGAVVPKELIDKLKKAKEFGKALWVRHQMFYAGVSLNFHRADPKGLDHDKLVAEMQARYSPYPFVEGTHMQHSFGHLYGYSAIYYTYMWSLVIAKDMFSAFESAGILDKATAMKYRRTILGQGGNKPAAELVSDFLGRPYGFAAFEKWLNRD